MDDIAIRVENLSKLYRLGRAQQRHDTLRDALVGALPRIPRISQKGNDNSSNSTEGSWQKDSDLWALKDVSFEVKQGEVVGIIGRNGAGKSTLLKILSRITEPTSGRAEIHGRVASLLEVGSGFHPELTGRENIYLNGAILGMHKGEIERKFDEIVVFAEIGRFLDTPVKRFSSGMYMRLAFAVAAHLEPEILLVDEVLAVGDAAFQEKCLGKMRDVAKEGRTVLFVSHNMAAITHLCEFGILIREGRLALQASAQETVAMYEHLMFAGLNENASIRDPHVLLESSASQTLSDFTIKRIEILDQEDQPKTQVRTWDTVKFRIHYTASRSVISGSAVLQISTRHGVPLLLLSTQPDSTLPLPIEPGENYVDCSINSMPLAAGEYVVGSGLAIPNKEWLCWDESLAILKVMERDVYRSGLAPTASRSLLAVEHQWKAPSC